MGSLEDMDAVFRRVDEEEQKVQRGRKLIEGLREELQVRMKKPSYTKAQVAQLQADEDPADQNKSWVERAFDGMDIMAVRGWMVAITMVWGINFPVMKLAMDSLDG